MGVSVNGIRELTYLLPRYREDPSAVSFWFSPVRSAHLRTEERCDLCAQRDER